MIENHGMVYRPARESPKAEAGMALLRGCLIGCGYVSQFHLEGWARQRLGRLVAVCDLDLARAQRACQHGVCTAYTDPREMLEREKPDFVEICTRPESHLTLIRLAAELGVHVLCQKPIAPTLGELIEMTRVCEQAGVRFMVHENFRWRGWYSRMKAELDGGRPRQPFRMGLTMHDQRCLQAGGLDSQPYFFDYPRLILYEIGPHAIDLARYFFGDPERVQCVTQHLGPQRGEDVALVTLWFPGRRVAMLDLSWATAARNTRPEWGLHDTWIEAAGGTMRTTLEGQLLWQPVEGPPELLHVPIDPNPMVEGYANTQTHFLERLQSGQPFVTDGHDSFKTMQTIFAAYDSAERGEVIDLHLDGTEGKR
jgi:predicted dehydrogenase